MGPLRVLARSDWLGDACGPQHYVLFDSGWMGPVEPMPPGTWTSAEVDTSDYGEWLDYVRRMALTVPPAMLPTYSYGFCFQFDLDKVVRPFFLSASALPHAGPGGVPTPRPPSVPSISPNVGLPRPSWVPLPTVPGVPSVPGVPTLPSVADLMRLVDSAAQEAYCDSAGPVDATMRTYLVDVLNGKVVHPSLLNLEPATRVCLLYYDRTYRPAVTHGPPGAWFTLKAYFGTVGGVDAPYTGTCMTLGRFA